MYPVANNSILFKELLVTIDWKKGEGMSRDISKAIISPVTNNYSFLKG